MKRTWLFRVFDAFNVRGNGWVLLPGVRRGTTEVQAGDAVTLQGGKGPARTGRVRAVGAFAPTQDAGDAMPLLVELDPTDRPLLIGAEVWLEPEAKA